MSKHRAYLIAQSLVCAMAAGLMAYAAISLYRDGAAETAGGDLFNYIYTRERVAAKLAPILPLIFAGLGMTIAGWLLGVKDEDAEKPVQDPEILRDLTCAKVQTPSDAMTAERNRQKKLLWTGWIGFFACMIPIAVYCLNGEHFDRPMDTEADLLALLKTVAPFTALGFACLIAATVARQRSMARETEAAKAQAAAERASGAKAAPAAAPAKDIAVSLGIARGAPSPAARVLPHCGGEAFGETMEVQKAPHRSGELSPHATEGHPLRKVNIISFKGVPQDGGRAVLILRLALAALAVALIAAGIRNGGLEDVLTKANAICMECVGLG